MVIDLCRKQNIVGKVKKKKLDLDLLDLQKQQLIHLYILGNNTKQKPTMLLIYSFFLI